jgi:hypothetical protein
LFQFASISLKQASPCIFQSIIVNQTSIIIASFLTIFFVNNHGFQAARITISDFFVNSSIEGVLLLQLITVAQAFISNAAIGFHTILLLPIIVTIFQLTFSHISFNISIIQAGVQGTNQESFQINTFH